jgi:hypothetical protein
MSPDYSMLFIDNYRQHRTNGCTSTASYNTNITVYRKEPVTEDDELKKLSCAYSDAVTHPMDINKTNHALAHCAKQAKRYTQKSFSHRRT